MSRLPITIATRDYDRVRALIDDRVQVEGCDVNYITMPASQGVTGRVACGDVEIFYRKFGTPGRTPMLIVHGLSFFSTTGSTPVRGSRRTAKSWPSICAASGNPAGAQAGTTSWKA